MTQDRIEEHIELIRGQIQKSLEDPATRFLAGALVAGNFDSAIDPRTGVAVPVVPYHGRFYRAAPSWETASRVCMGRDKRCELVAIWNFCVMNIRYTDDQHGEDTYQDLRMTLETGAGDCDDFTIAFAALLHAVGFEDIVARVISLSGDAWEHIYPRVLVVDAPAQRVEWIPLDATETHPPRPLGWEYPRAAVARDFAI